MSTLPAEPPFVFLSEEEKMRLKFLGESIRLRTKSTVLTELIVSSGRLLGPGLKLYPSNEQLMINKD